LKGRKHLTYRGAEGKLILKRGFKQLRKKGMGCTPLAHDTDQLWAFVSMEINLRVLKKLVNFSTRRIMLKPC
jgi:hypothetical protein